MFHTHESRIPLSSCSARWLSHFLCECSPHITFDVAEEA
uniref:Uncharacterized protein n=1 Tax=Anguilla anguilla TaxID=7936 RepID=A0A0E9WK10_ANGAN